MKKSNKSSGVMLKVWLVEDNSIFATGLERIVNRFDEMKCSGNFRSVEEAFEALQAGEFDAVRKGVGRLSQACDSGHENYR